MTLDPDAASERRVLADLIRSQAEPLELQGDDKNEDSMVSSLAAMAAVPPEYNARRWSAG